MATLTIGNLRLYYEVTGSGDPLMLIAGLGSDSQSWGPILHDLARHHTIITLDNRGVGRTTPLNTDLSITQMANDCMMLVDHLGFHSISVLGHSMGGLIAMECSIRDADRIKKLILAGTSASFSKRNRALLCDWATFLESGMDPELWFRNVFYWVFSPRFFEDDEAVKEAIRMELAYPYPLEAFPFRKQVEAISEFNPTRPISSIAAKTLVIAGKEDLLILPEESAWLSKAIPGADFSLIDHTAHSLFIENPGDFVSQVLNFMAEEKK